MASAGRGHSDARASYPCINSTFMWSGDRFVDDQTGSRTNFDALECRNRWFGAPGCFFQNRSWAIHRLQPVLRGRCAGTARLCFETDALRGSRRDIKQPVLVSHRSLKMSPRFIRLTVAYSLTLIQADFCRVLPARCRCVGRQTNKT